MLIRCTAGIVIFHLVSDLATGLQIVSVFLVRCSKNQG